MPVYADDWTVAEARARYFETNGFGADGGYDDDWVRFAVGPFPIRFPNTDGRKAAVPAHDLHHVATGYDTDLAGEGEIGAWEIASGCWQARAAWLLNSLAVWPVLFYALPRVYRAFVRGRHSRNLYDGTPVAELLDAKVAVLRARLGLDVPAPPATTADKLAFARFLATVLALQLAIALVLFGLPALAIAALF
ncbi:MAG: hypothetical protein ACQGVC_20975 [Myxococcota bacterium]